MTEHRVSGALHGLVVRLKCLPQADYPFKNSVMLPSQAETLLQRHVVFDQVGVA
jgi:hypothetical protein